MVSARQNSLDAWTVISLIGLLVPLLAMLAFGFDRLEIRLRGMVSYSTICLPGIAFVVSVIGEQVESGLGFNRPWVFIFLFACGAVLFVFVGVSAIGTFEPPQSEKYTVGTICFFLLLQFMATITAVFASAAIKSSLTHR